MDSRGRRGLRSSLWILAAGAATLLLLAGASRWMAQSDGESPSVKDPAAGAGRDEAASTPPVPVSTVVAQRGTITRSEPVAGVIRAATETQLASRLPARILAVTVHEGERVHRGQLLVLLDDRDARATLDAAEAGVRAAEAALEKAQGGAKVRGEELTTGVASAEAAVQAARGKLAQAREAAIAAEAEAGAELRRAEAGLDAARANTATVMRGPRPEQLQQAESAVAQAEAAARTARQGVEEAQFLYDRGGLTRTQLDEARVAEETTRAQLESARAGRELVRQGATPEERQAAAAAVRQAEAGVEAARAGQRRAALATHDATAAEAQLRQAEAGLRAARAGQAGRGMVRADVRAAAAALAQSQVQRRQASEQVAATRLLSPVEGVLTLRTAEPGQIAQPGQPLVTIASGARFFEAPVSPATVALLRVGQSVILTSDAATGRQFNAVLLEVPAVPGPDGRSYLVRAELGAAALPPGVRARGTVQVAHAADAVLVPAAAVARRNGETILWVARGGRAERRHVQLGVETDTQAQVLTGVRVGEAVILSGAEGLRAGDAVDAGGQHRGTQPRSESFADFGPLGHHPQSSIQRNTVRWG
jgi:HlyD family secretion protein